MRRLIINADGFGFTFGNNRAIEEVLEQGAVKSVSVNANFPAAEQAPELARRFPEVSFGIHWNLSVGRPVSAPDRVRTLLGPDGEFANASLRLRAVLRRLSPAEIRLELDAQLRKLESLGLQVTHWDSHQHRHVLPGFFEAAVEVARAHGLRAARSTTYYLLFQPPRRVRLLLDFAGHPQRIVSDAIAKSRSRALRRAGFALPDYHAGIRAFGMGAEHSVAAWSHLFRTLPSGIGCIAVHPGYPDETLRRYSTMIGSRAEELALLRGPDIGRLAREAGVDLVSFRHLIGCSSSAVRA